MAGSACPPTLTALKSLTGFKAAKVGAFKDFVSKSLKRLPQSLEGLSKALCLAARLKVFQGFRVFDRNSPYWPDRLVRVLLLPL